MTTHHSIAASEHPATGNFTPAAALHALLGDVGLDAGVTGGDIIFRGADPVVRSRLRLGAAIGIPIMGSAVAAEALHRQRGGPSQDLSIDLRQAVHYITPDAFWHPTIAGAPASNAVTMDNPFLLRPYETRDNRWVMASGVYPHLAAAWCRFLDVPPSEDRVAAGIARWDSGRLEDAASAEGLPIAIARTPAEWVAHPQGAVVAAQPVITLRRIGEAPPRTLAAAPRPLADVRVLSFSHAIAGPTVGRTLAEQGADVLCVTRPNDFEHDFIYDTANVGSRSTNLDLSTALGRHAVNTLLEGAHVVVNNHRPGKLARYGIGAKQLAQTHPGVIYVSITSYGDSGPWAARGGFDMNGSAASGLMSLEGGEGNPVLPPTGMINDFITGYLGALGATAALRRQALDGGSWAVHVNLTRTAMWCGSLGVVDPALVNSSDDHQLRKPQPYDADTPLGAVHMLAPPVTFSATPARWADPILVPKGSSAPRWAGQGPDADSGSGDVTPPRTYQER